MERNFAQDRDYGHLGQRQGGENSIFQTIHERTNAETSGTIDDKKSAVPLPRFVPEIQWKMMYILGRVTVYTKHKVNVILAKF